MDEFAVVTQYCTNTLPPSSLNISTPYSYYGTAFSTPLPLQSSSFYNLSLTISLPALGQMAALRLISGSRYLSTAVTLELEKSIAFTPMRAIPTSVYGTFYGNENRIFTLLQAGTYTIWFNPTDTLPTLSATVRPDSIACFFSCLFILFSVCHLISRWRWNSCTTQTSLFPPSHSLWTSLFMHFHSPIIISTKAFSSMRRAIWVSMLRSAVLCARLQLELISWVLEERVRERESVGECEWGVWKANRHWIWPYLRLYLQLFLADAPGEAISTHGSQQTMTAVLDPGVYYIEFESTMAYTPADIEFALQPYSDDQFAIQCPTIQTYEKGRERWG